MSIELPNKELHAAIKQGAADAGCTDPVHATATAIEAFTRGEFTDESQVAAWFDLQRIKKPALWVEPETETGPGISNGAPAATKAKGATNPWSPQFKGTDAQRQQEIKNWIKRWGTKSAQQEADRHTTDIAGRPLRVAS